MGKYPGYWSIFSWIQSYIYMSHMYVQSTVLYPEHKCKKTIRMLYIYFCILCVSMQYICASVLLQHSIRIKCILLRCMYWCILYTFDTSVLSLTFATFKKHTTFSVSVLFLLNDLKLNKEAYLIEPAISFIR